jgi:hypothetical protein
MQVSRKQCKTGLRYSMSFTFGKAIIALETATITWVKQRELRQLMWEADVQFGLL